MPEAEKWDKDKLSAISLTPMSLHQPREPEVVFKDKIDTEKPEYVDKPQLARQVYLRPKDFEEHGLTRGCPKCDHFRRYDRWGSMPHSAVCRTRVTTELSKTVAGRARLGAAAERLDKTVEELGQRFRTDVPQGEIEPVVQHQPEPVTPHFSQPEFLPMNGDDGHVEVENHESGEVPPPADQPGLGETRRQLEFLSNDPPIAREPMEVTYGDSMDVNVVEDGPDTELKDLLAVLQREEKVEVVEANREILAIVRSLGGDRGKYKRERSKALKAVVSEIYSPPRVTNAAKLLPELRLIPGFGLDLTVADHGGKLWDFDSKVMRERAMEKVKREKPLLLVGSPMCTAFSTWQRINAKIRDPYIVECEKRRAIMHLDFCCELYREQERLVAGVYQEGAG